MKEPSQDFIHILRSAPDTSMIVSPRALKNGMAHAVAGFTDAGNIRLDSGDVISKDAGMFRHGFVERRVQGEVVAGLLGVSLIAFEIVDGRADSLPGFLSRANSINPVPDHEQRLEGDHDLVVLDEVAGEQQDFLGGH